MPAPQRSSAGVPGRKWRETAEGRADELAETIRRLRLNGASHDAQPVVDARRRLDLLLGCLAIAEAISGLETTMRRRV